MKNYLAVDSGGSKVLAILYDEDFRPIKTCRVGSMRDNTTSPALVRRNVDTLIENLGLAGMEIDCLTGIVDGGLIERLRSMGTIIRSASGCGELEAGLSAAEIFGDALMALSGTGATLFYRYNGHADGLGGYGASVSDEGSGYWMARNAFGAAIKDSEGRGPKTLLTELIAEQLGRPSDLRGAIFHIYDRREMSPVACVASCAPVVSMAAEAGDEIALQILRETGKVLADQLIAVVRKFELPKDLPITISGSVWRSHHALFDEFAGTMRDFGMEREVTIPAFEPIAGVIIRHYHSLYGKFGAEERERFLKLYKDFTFSLSK
jgi:N-acetylglucosamine kinase-like BadF-type ATPase